jgi:hypothetical protein
MRKSVSLSLGGLCLTALVAAVYFAGSVSIAAADDSAGHCSFTLKNQWVGPLKACMAPASAALCEETGKKDENSGAVHAMGACPVEKMVGTCKTEKYSLSYYEGEAGNLEIGCGFQSGEWTTAGK